MQALSQSTKIYILAILDVISKIASYKVQPCTCTSAKLHGVTGWYCICAYTDASNIRSTPSFQLIYYTVT